MNKIGVIGCGWLGMPLAVHLATLYSRVKGTSRSTIKLEELQRQGVDAFLILLEDTQIKGNFNAFIRDLDTVIIAVNALPTEDYFNKIDTLCKYITRSKVKNIIFLSSISVYEDVNKVVDETEIVNSQSIYARVENIFKKNPRFNTTILRLGGLVGEDRHPIASITGKEMRQNPNMPINLVHRKDCIYIITLIIQKKLWNETFNVVYPYYPSKLEYYTKVANDRKLAPPIYDETIAFKGKVVSSTKIIEHLGYNFSFEI